MSFPHVLGYFWRLGSSPRERNIATDTAPIRNSTAQRAQNSAQDHQKRSQQYADRHTGHNYNDFLHLPSSIGVIWHWVKGKMAYFSRIKWFGRLRLGKSSHPHPLQHINTCSPIMLCMFPYMFCMYILYVKVVMLGVGKCWKP